MKSKILFYLYLKITNKWNCPICHKDKFVIIKRNKNKLFKNSFIVECLNCKLKSLYPFPDKLALERINQKFWKIQTNSEEDNKFYYAQAFNRYQYLISQRYNFGNIKILDVGSGHAYFFDILKAQNHCFSYHCVEPDIEMKKYLNIKGIEKIFSNIEEIYIPDKYDLILLSHMLEHLPDPNSFLKKIYNYLNENGTVYLEVPNQDDLFKSDLGLHLLVFNSKSLKNLLIPLGWDIRGMSTFGVNINDIRDTFLKKIVRKLNNKKIKYNDNFDERENGRWLRCMLYRKQG